MPIRDWSRVDAGIFHDFHQAWTIEIANTLNAGKLPRGFFALVPPPQETGDVVEGGVRPRGRAVESERYARRANRIAINRGFGHVVAIIEIVSPGNKGRPPALRSFARKAYKLLQKGINLLVVDLFPPLSRDPQGIHNVIWNEICDEYFVLPPDKPLTVAAYCAGKPKTAYVEPVAIGDPLPSLPIFLDPGTYVPAPEATYQTAWDKCPDVLREFVENPDA